MEVSPNPETFEFPNDAAHPNAPSRVLRAPTDHNNAKMNAEVAENTEEERESKILFEFLCIFFFAFSAASAFISYWCIIQL